MCVFGFKNTVEISNHEENYENWIICAWNVAINSEFEWRREIASLALHCIWAQFILPEGWIKSSKSITRAENKKNARNYFIQIIIVMNNIQTFFNKAAAKGAWVLHFVDSITNALFIKSISWLYMLLLLKSFSILFLFYVAFYFKWAKAFNHLYKPLFEFPIFKCNFWNETRKEKKKTQFSSRGLLNFGIRNQWCVRRNSGTTFIQLIL